MRPQKRQKEPTLKIPWSGSSGLQNPETGHFWGLFVIAVLADSYGCQNAPTRGPCITPRRLPWQEAVDGAAQTVDFYFLPLWRQRVRVPGGAETALSQGLAPWHVDPIFLLCPHVLERRKSSDISSSSYKDMSLSTGNPS